MLTTGFGSTIKFEGYFCDHICRVYYHDGVIKWIHFPRYWPFVRGIHRSPVNSPRKGQWRGALMFSLICIWINGRANNREAGDLRRYRAHYDVIVMGFWYICGSHLGYIRSDFFIVSVLQFFIPMNLVCKWGEAHLLAVYHLNLDY